MARPMLPFKLSCSHCGWHKVAAPASDALNAREVPICCPSCGNPHLNWSKPTFLESILLKLGSHSVR